jgi:mRNA deadenylase 3'-5' endonuclease subunit Ccr4
MQEVQGTTKEHPKDHFNDLKRTLEEFGYVCGAYGRLADKNGFELGTEKGSKSMKKPHIGNAIFIQNKVWQKLSEGRINFASILAKRCAENTAQSNHYAEGMQVAVWVRLRHIHTQKVVVVVCVHISANWRNPDTQVAQVDSMLHELRHVVEAGDCLVVGGDFNSMPSSGVYKLLSTGALAADHEDSCPKKPEVPRLCTDDGY